MASITERAQRMEKDLRESNAKHDRAAAELQVSLANSRVRAWIRACSATAWVYPCREVHGEYRKAAVIVFSAFSTTRIRCKAIVLALVR